jgi:hypothetical protein
MMSVGLILERIMRIHGRRWLSIVCLAPASLTAAVAEAGPLGRTSLTNPALKGKEPVVHQIEMKRGPVCIVLADNEAFGPDHRAGYNGVASLTHESRKRNVFVPLYAGLNFELIHDGTKVSRDRMMEPRRAPMELRKVDDFAAELHQAPTPTWHLESCTRFRLLEDGTIEMAFECIPRKAVFEQGYIGLFWASYIDKPESKAVHFIGRPRSAPAETKPDWIDAITPKHGVESTHVASFDDRQLKPAADFPMNYMAFSYSKYHYAEPFYYGVSHGMAAAMVFRKQDLIRFTQSPSGGGQGNPAWDFQFMIPDYQVGKAYGFVMRLVYAPFKDRQTLDAICRRHVKALAGGAR